MYEQKPFLKFFENPLKNYLEFFRRRKQFANIEIAESSKESKPLCFYEGENAHQMSQNTETIGNGEKFS